MEYEFKAEDAKTAGNTARNLVLAVCYSGLFFMIVVGAMAVAIVVFGSKVLSADLGYLLAVSFYLGLVVLALAGVMLNFTGPQKAAGIPVFIRKRR